jgi:hypothetical protein
MLVVSTWTPEGAEPIVGAAPGPGSGGQRQLFGRSHPVLVVFEGWSVAASGAESCSTGWGRSVLSIADLATQWDRWLGAIERPAEAAHTETRKKRGL